MVGRLLSSFRKVLWSASSHRCVNKVTMFTGIYLLNKSSKIEALGDVGLCAGEWRLAYLERASLRKGQFP